MDRAITRRTAVLAGIAGAAALGLAGCAAPAEPAARIDEANRELIGSTDASSVTLPLGSVVETAFGRWMVAGHKVVTRAGSGGYYSYDYYGIAWPRGVEVVGAEVMSAALFNRGQVQAILFVGRMDDEDADFRAYIEGYDYEGFRSKHDVSPDGPQGVANATSLVGAEQQMRLQGARSDELYGASFGGGALYSDAEQKAAQATGESAG